MRSEEHTSELQSPCNLVCRLLLEKKNKRQNRPSGGWRGGREQHWWCRISCARCRRWRSQPRQCEVRLCVCHVFFFFFFLNEAPPPNFPPSPHPPLLLP